MYEQLRKELYDFYLKGDAERSQAFANKCFAILDEKYKEGMSVVEQKLLQYDVISDNFQPVIFKSLPFYYETGVLTSLSDGNRNAKGLSFVQANGWVFRRNHRLFEEQDPALYKLRNAHLSEKLYLVCGPYNDVSQHFNLNSRPYIFIGAKGIYDQAQKELVNAKTEEEKEFLLSVCQGMLTLKKVAEKFAQKALDMLETETDETAKENLALIAKTAKRVPWDAPKTFYEGLETLAFLRTVVGSLEGIGPNTFGRVDKDLIALYDADIANGTLTPKQAYDLVCKFLLIWDCHYDHDMIMEGYADHESENTYVLGGCDDEGNPLYNEVTKMFLRAAREENIIFPKIKCRYSGNSPKEYLDEMDKAIVKGTSTIIIQNDEASIASLLRAGRTLQEARDYLITGCWGMTTDKEKFDHGNYLNLLKPFEYAVHNLTDKMEKVQIKFDSFDDCENFEDLYRKTVVNCERLLSAKLDVTRKGGQIFHKVDRLPIFSATLGDCIKNRKDFTAGGAKYRDDFQLMFGLPNIVDSLLAMKTLIWDTKKYTLKEYLKAVRANWEGYEDMRIEATKCHGWGDGSEESCALANRFNNDLFAICQRAKGTYGGKVHMGHLTYTEIRWWGEQTLATPDGRKNGQYFSQGLTPSRLKKIPCVNDVVNSLACLDKSTLAANSVVNIILPGNISLDRCEGFLRVLSKTAVESLQLNCVSREDLLDAQIHPEKYPYLIVRVTGFSAKFTSLSKGWQDEFLSRNYYD